MVWLADSVIRTTNTEHLNMNIPKRVFSSFIIIVDTDISMMWIYLFILLWILIVTFCFSGNPMFWYNDNFSENSKAVRSVHEFGLVIQAVKCFQCEIEQLKPQHVTRAFYSTTIRTSWLVTKSYFVRMEQHLALPNLEVFRNTLPGHCICPGKPMKFTTF